MVWVLVVVVVICLHLCSFSLFAACDVLVCLLVGVLDLYFCFWFVLLGLDLCCLDFGLDWF